MDSWWSYNPHMLLVTNSLSHSEVISFHTQAWCELLSCQGHCSMARTQWWREQPCHWARWSHLLSPFFCSWAHFQREQLPGCGQGMQPWWHLQEVQVRLHHPVHQQHVQRGVQPPQVPQGSPAVLRQGASEAQLRDALLLMPRYCLHRAQASDHRARVFLWGERETQLPESPGLLQDQLHLQVSIPSATGRPQGPTPFVAAFVVRHPFLIFLCGRTDAGLSMECSGLKCLDVEFSTPRQVHLIGANFHLKTWKSFRGTWLKTVSTEGS